jgi:hypothetical protein
MWLAGTARPRAEELAAIEKFLQAREKCRVFCFALGIVVARVSQNGLRRPWTFAGALKS